MTEPQFVLFLLLVVAGFNSAYYANKVAKDLRDISDLEQLSQATLQSAQQLQSDIQDSLEPEFKSKELAMDVAVLSAAIRLQGNWLPSNMAQFRNACIAAIAFSAVLSAQAGIIVLGLFCVTFSSGALRFWISRMKR